MPALATLPWDYPLWQFSGINAGLLIAIIAVVHLFVAQFAVGGGFFLVMAEAKGHREDSGRILLWAHGHTKFFLLLTMVFGSMTGVGIWLVVALVAPGGTAFLVREFLYAWAAEWVFFLGEILALLLYAASFSRCRAGGMAPRDHMLLGWGYCLFAFFSLFIINGIVSFMLTPGDFPQGGFLAALFNPGFWPALCFRFGLCLVLAGLFGLVTATAVRHEPTRLSLVRFCAAWICLPFVLMAAGGLWHMSILPEDVQAAVLRKTSDIRPFARAFIDTAPLLFLAGMLLFVRLPQKAYRPLVLVFLAIGLVVAGSYEWVRETARRPWLIHGQLYSSGISAGQNAQMREKGAWEAAGWGRLQSGAAKNATVAQLTPRQRASFGAFLFARQCSSCHGLGAPMLDIKPRVAGRGAKGVEALLAAQGSISPYMPPFAGTREERRLLAEWLAALSDTK